MLGSKQLNVKNTSRLELNIQHLDVFVNISFKLNFTVENYDRKM